METVNESKSNIGFTYGLISGLIIVVILLLQYLGGVDMYMSPVGSVSYLVIATFAVLAALKVRKANEGFLEFRDALKITFTVFAVAMFLQTIFNFILLNFIDPSFKEALSQEALNAAEKWMKKFGASEDEIEKAIEQQQNIDPFTFGRVLLGYGITCIVAFLFCLLISAIVRRKKPEFNNL